MADMDDSDTELIVTSTVIAYLIRKKQRSQRRKRRFSVRPVYRLRPQLGEFNTFFNEIKRSDPELFFKYTRMTSSLFDKLLQIVSPKMKIRSQASNVISHEERLALTLRYC